MRNWAWKYGIDWGRYVVKDGEKLMVEPYPFGGYTPLALWYRLTQRIGVIKWHIAMIITNRNHLRDY